MNQNIRDNGGRRSGRDRRLFFYAAHLPERRTGLDRRSGQDRRVEYDPVQEAAPADRRGMAQVRMLVANY